MSKMKSLMFGLIAALLMTLAACDTATAPEKPIDTEAPQDQKDPFWYECNKFVSANLPRQKPGDYRIVYSLDNQGRPVDVRLPRLGTGSGGNRQPNCQGKVGNLFEEPKVFDDLNGGHLIGDQFGGWGGRVNLVAQDATLNQTGPWAQIEAQAAKCSYSANIQMTGLAIYFPRNASIEPDQMQLIFLDNSTKESKGAKFDNVADGGPNGASQATKVINWLESKGCS